MERRSSEPGRSTCVTLMPVLEATQTKLEYSEHKVVDDVKNLEHECENEKKKRLQKLLHVDFRGRAQIHQTKPDKNGFETWRAPTKNNEIDINLLKQLAQPRLLEQPKTRPSTKVSVTRKDQHYILKTGGSQKVR